MKINKLLQRYNIAINILFWLIIITMVLVIILFYAKPDLEVSKYLYGRIFQKEVIVQTQPVVVTEYKEVEKKSEWFYFIATAYSGDDASQGTDSFTATGKKAAEGIIAVDPEIIPYGTMVEIKDIGYFTAEDCGNKIKGNRIDIYFDTRQEAEQFGRQGIWLRIPYDSSIKLSSLLESSKYSFK